jgi:hypothetical protein
MANEKVSPQYTVFGADGKEVVSVQLPEGGKIIESRGTVEFRDGQIMLGVASLAGGPVFVRSDLVVAKPAPVAPAIPAPPGR